MKKNWLPGYAIQQEAALSIAPLSVPRVSEWYGHPPLLPPPARSGLHVSREYAPPLRRSQPPAEPRHRRRCLSIQHSSHWRQVCAQRPRQLLVSDLWLARRSRLVSHPRSLYPIHVQSERHRRLSSASSALELRTSPRQQGSPELHLPALLLPTCDSQKSRAHSDARPLTLRQAAQGIGRYAGPLVRPYEISSPS